MTIAGCTLNTFVLSAIVLLIQINYISCFSTEMHQKRYNTNKCQYAKNNNAQDMTNNDEKKDTLRKTVLGLTLPLAVAISANAPFLYVILNPPTADEREVMLMDFCQGDTCTLLGGGSGYGGGDTGGDMIGADALASIPTLEEVEAMARTAAEMADTLTDSIL